MISKKNYDSLKAKYGKIASWAIWAAPTDNPKSNMRDVSMFDDDKILKQLNDEYVFVGLNGSGVHDDYMDNSRPWRFFHSSNPHGNDYKLRYALMGTKYWGSYITDIIKEFEEVDSTKVDYYLRNHEEVVKKNIEEFEKEISLISDNPPTLIALGTQTYSILKKYLGHKYKIIKVMHYANYCGKEKYRKSVLEALDEIYHEPKIVIQQLPEKKSSKVQPKEKKIILQDSEYTYRDFFEYFVSNAGSQFQREYGNSYTIKKDPNKGVMNLITDMKGTSIPIYVTKKNIKINLFFDGDKAARSAFLNANKDAIEKKYGITLEGNSKGTAYGESIEIDFQRENWDQMVDWFKQKSALYKIIRADFESHFNNNMAF